VRWIRNKFLLFALLALSLQSLSGNAQAKTFIPQMPTDFERVHVYLLTIGRSEPPYARFGHTVLRIIDYSQGYDYNFNWGVFDFDDPAFLLNFYTGKSRYWMQAMSYDSVLRVYRDMEERWVIQDTINLTTDQKKRLMTKIIWNSQPENLHYIYHYFYDNCSTKVRDYFDEILNGQLKLRFEDALQGITLRETVRQHLSGQWWAFLGADMSFNSTVDYNMSKWQLMYLPSMLRKYLLELPRFDDSGKPIPDTSLLSDEKPIVENPEPPTGINPFHGAFFLMALPLAWIGLIYRLKVQGQKDSEPLTGVNRGLLRFFGVFLILYGVWTSCWGIILPINWLFSGHGELHHNALIWQFWPTDATYLVCGIALMAKGRPLKNSLGSRLSRVFAMAHIPATIIVGCLVGFEIIAQDIKWPIMYFGSLSIFINVLFVKMAISLEE
jgi:hypothetical protein